MSPCSLSDIRDRERKCVAFYVLYAHCIIKTLHWGYVFLYSGVVWREVVGELKAIMNDFDSKRWTLNWFLTVF